MEWYEKLGYADELDARLARPTHVTEPVIKIVHAFSESECEIDDDVDV